jgi:hypothetical protein
MQSSKCSNDEFIRVTDDLEARMFKLDHIAHLSLTSSEFNSSFIERYEPIYIQR